MRRMMVALATIPLAACTPGEIRAWHAWHRADPQAAEAHANSPEVQAELAAAPASEPEPETIQRGVWDRLAQCESGGNWSINTGNGYYGGLQFGMTAWRATGGSGRPDQNSREEQIRRAEILLDMQGWGAWPACSRRLGLR
jgi:ferric-dicitrate binding protein FerR (iron transport regulator)